MPAVRCSKRSNGSGGGEESGAVAGNATLAHPGGSVSSIFSDTRHANPSGARELASHDSLARQEAVRGENADGGDGENEPGSQYAVGPPTATTPRQSVLSVDGEFETSDTANGQDPNGWEDAAEIASGERRSMETD